MIELPILTMLRNLPDIVDIVCDGILNPELEFFIEDAIVLDVIILDLMLEINLAFITIIFVKKLIYLHGYEGAIKMLQYIKESLESEQNITNEHYCIKSLGF